jgi:aminopeptidase N
LNLFDLHTAQPESARAAIFSRHGEAALAYFSTLLGSAPGRPQLVLVSRPRKSGYARRGYVVVVDDGQAAIEAPLASFIAHEFGHLWFGNANATTRHRWLDESISEYLALRYVEHGMGSAARDAMIERKRTSAAGIGQVLRPEAGTPALYSKGPLILLDLERKIGRPALDKILATAASRKTATTEEFLGIVAAHSAEAQADWLEAALLASNQQE